MSWAVTFSILSYRGQTPAYLERETAEQVARIYAAEGYRVRVRRVPEEAEAPTRRPRVLVIAE